MTGIRVLAIGGSVPTATSDALAEHAIEIHAAATPDDALEQWSSEAFDAVLGIAGDGAVHGFTRELVEAFPDLPLVIGVAEGRRPRLEDVLEPGAVDYVTMADLRDHGAVVAHRLETAVTASQATGARADLEESREDLEQAANTLTATAEATASVNLDLEAKLDRILAIGAEEMEYPIGYVTRIESGTQEVLAATGDHEAIQPGAIDPLGRTYCRKTIENDEPLVLEDALEEGWADDPAYQQLGLRCYVGARIVVDGEVYGTVCFADDQPREGVVGDVHQSTITALARWIGYEIERHQRESELETATERIRALFEKTADGIVVHDEEGTILDVNETIVDALGYSREELLSMDVTDFEVGFDPAFLEGAWEELDEERPLKVEGTHRRNDGSTYPVEIWVSRIELEDGDRFVATCRDITERKERERELERYEHLWRNLPVGVCRVDPSGDGEFLEVNEALLGIVGAESREEVFECSVAELWIDESERDALLDRLAETGTETVEHRFETLDGRRVWLQLTLMGREDGRYVDAVVQDVTERRQREIHLEKAQEVGNVGWWKKDIPSDKIYWSERIYEMWGAEGEVGLIDHETFMEFIHPEDEERVERDWEAAKEGKPYDIEHRVVTGDGEVRWMREKADLTVDEDGQPMDAVGIVQDITERKERERQLERHRAYLESANDMITLIDPDGTIEYISPAVERVLGYAPADLIGKNGFEYVHPDDREARIADVEDLVEEPGDETVLEFRFQKADGGYCWIEATARNLLSDPDVEGLLLSSRDVTERKEHEQQLSALHGATREFIDADSKDEIAEITVKTANRLLDFSLPSVWYPTDDGSELALVANSPEHQRLLEEAGTPDPAHPRDSWLWDVFEDGETTVRSPISREELAADVPLQSAIVLSLGEHGIFACAAKGEIGFTDRQVRAAEILARNVRVALEQLDQRAALERQKEFTDDLLNAIEDVVYVLDSDGDLLEWNDALEAVTGYTSGEIATMNATDFFADEDARAAAQAVEEAFETGRTRIELDFRTADGEEIPYEFTANTFEDPDGQPVMAGIGRDRSLHVEYERTLQEQRDRLDLLNQVVRHDVRNDMQVVHGRAQMLEDYVEEGGKEHLREVQHATAEVIELTKTARDLTETMLREDDELQTVPLREHLESQLEGIRTQHSDAVVRTDGTVPPVDVHADEMIEAVFRNLLQNAVVHNDKDVPEVTVSVDVDDDRAVVSIADNGPGVPDAQKEEIFGKGEKGLDSPGTGLGLYLVKTLVERYGGEVWVEDREADSREASDERAGAERHASSEVDQGETSERANGKAVSSEADSREASKKASGEAASSEVDQGEPTDGAVFVVELPVASRRTVPVEC